MPDSMLVLLETLETWQDKNLAFWKESFSICSRMLVSKAQTSGLCQANMLLAYSFNFKYHIDEENS